MRYQLSALCFLGFAISACGDAEKEEETLAEGRTAGDCSDIIGVSSKLAFRSKSAGLYRSLVKFQPLFL